MAINLNLQEIFKFGKAYFSLGQQYWCDYYITIQNMLEDMTYKLRIFL